jgi:hypothetical protein
MEVETGGIFRQYGGKMTGKLPPTRSRDRIIHLYIAEHKRGYEGLPNSKRAETCGH